ncbi:MAG: hypothetical protein IPM42_08560 [Saprospiraceae bacterium]|nr:hypothetical protein [Saprospiraceae bacterium]
MHFSCAVGAEHAREGGWGLMPKKPVVVDMPSGWEAQKEHQQQLQRILKKK